MYLGKKRADLKIRKKMLHQVLGRYLKDKCGK